MTQVRARHQIRNDAEGQALEYDGICGAVLRAARRHGIKVPATETVYTLLKLLGGIRESRPLTRVNPATLRSAGRFEYGAPRLGTRGLKSDRFRSAPCTLPSATVREITDVLCVGAPLPTRAPAPAFRSRILGFPVLRSMRSFAVGSLHRSMERRHERNAS
jgi:Ketopantoate reductase PanE/ApbA C terminal